MPPTTLITACETSVDQLDASQKKVKDLRNELDKLTSSKFAAFDKKIIAKLLVAFVPIGGAAIVAGSPALLGLLGGALIGIMVGICVSCAHPKAAAFVGIVGALGGGAFGLYYIIKHTTLFQTTTASLLTPLLTTPIGWLILTISAFSLIFALSGLRTNTKSVKVRIVALRKEIETLDTNIQIQRDGLRDRLMTLSSHQMTIKLKDALSDLTSQKLGIVKDGRIVRYR